MQIMKRRQVLGVAATTGALALAGCTDLFDDTEEISRTFETTTSALEHPDTHATIPGDTFHTFANSMRGHREFGDAGVWGTANERPNEETPMLSALTKTLQHASGARSHHALAAFRLYDYEGTDETHNQLWCWSGYNVADIDQHLTAITIELDAEDVDVEIGVYAPRRSYSGDEEYHVDTSLRVDRLGQGSTFPLPNGSIGPVERTSIGPGGQVAIRWEGSIPDRFGIATSVEAFWDEQGTYDLDWTVGATIE